GVADDKLAADQVRPDHVVDGIPPGAADPDDGNAGLKLLLVPRDAKIDHALALHACAFVIVPAALPCRRAAGSPLVPIAAIGARAAPVRLCSPDEAIQ